LDIDIFSFKPSKKLATPINIIVPGRIAPVKRICDVIPFLAELEKNNIHAKATLVGKIFDIEYHELLLSKIEHSGYQNRIEIKSMVKHEEMVKLYQDSDICFFPSIQEVGLSRIPLEAMACGTLVVTYGKEGSGELVKHGVTGHVINKMEFYEMTQTIKSLLNQPDKYFEIIQTAREKIKANHTLETYATKIDDFLEKAVHEFHHQN
jgi:glycosyltransferase involved in cell wall biosynthesis